MDNEEEREQDQEGKKSKHSEDYYSFRHRLLKVSPKKQSDEKKFLRRILSYLITDAGEPR